MKKTVSEKSKIPLHNYIPKALKTLTVSILCFSSISTVNAATLGQKAVYSINVLPWADAAEVGQCSTFTFDDATTNVSTICADDPITTVPQRSHLEDNVSLPAPFISPVLSGGDGVLDGFAGVITIQTGLADISGNNTLVVLSYQMDPYLRTPGGVFKTTMTAPDGANMGIGTVSAVGDMTLDLTGQTGVAALFETTIGIQPWNIDDSLAMVGAGVPVTGLYDVMTTGNETNAAAATGLTLTDITGRAIGDANTDTILDAVLISAGNIGTGWQAFDGVPYSIAYNVQFVLVSAEPVAVADLLIGDPVTPLTITKATDLLANDLHADPAETISFLSFTQPADGTIADNGATLEYTPAAVPGASDTFTYTISDIAGNTDTVTVTINLPTTPPPIANDVPVSTDEDIPVTLDPTLNDTDANGDPDASIAIISFDLTTPVGGAIVAGPCHSLGTCNKLTYTPPQDYFGPDQFNYVIMDGAGNIANANVLVTVLSVNDPLVCTDVEFFTDLDTELTIDIAADLISTCTDAENDPITLTAVQVPSDQGADVNNTGSGTIIYTPPAGFAGDDAFTYTLSDGTDAVTQTAAVQVGLNLGNFTMLKPGDGAVFGGTNDVVFEWDGTTFNSSDVDESDIPTDTTFGIMTIVSKSEQLFFGFKWFAHHIRVYEGPGTFTFDTTCTVAQYEGGQTVCNGPLDTVFGQTEQFVTMTLEDGQVGAHILFDYNQSANIDVVNVYDRDGVWDRHGASGLVNKLWDGAAGDAPDETTKWNLVSRDVNGDGFNGNPMVDGPFIGYYANFNDAPGAAAPPPPPNTRIISETSLSALGLWSLITGLLTLVFMRRKVIAK